MNILEWKIEVIFINEYFDQFKKNESVERKDSEYRFELAIIEVIKQTGIVPQIEDWIDPLDKPDYSLDIGKISGRTFYPRKQKIVFEIE